MEVHFCIKTIAVILLGLGVYVCLGHEDSGYTTRHLIGREFVCLRMCGAPWGCVIVAHRDLVERVLAWEGPGAY